MILIRDLSHKRWCLSLYYYCVCFLLVLVITFCVIYQVLLVTSSANNELWIVPAGGIDPGETSEEAAVREVYEEVFCLILLNNAVNQLCLRK